MDDIIAITPEVLEKMTSGFSCMHYGLPIVEIDKKEFAIAANEEEANEACYEYIENTIWAFSPFFLEQMTNVPAEIFEAAHDKCDSINEALQILVRRTCGMQEFVDQAIAENGRGYFLSCWDGKELELDCGAYAYRIN